MSDTLQSDAQHPAAQSHTTEVQTSGQEQQPSLMSFDPGVALWTILTFVFLLLVLKKYAWGPILKALDDREKYIKDSLAEADQTRLESLNVADQHKKILDEARAQAQAFLAEAENAAKAVKLKIEQNAQEERDRILAETTRLISQEKDKALKELRTTVIQLSLDATKKLIDENLDEERSRALVEKYIGII